MYILLLFSTMLYIVVVVPFTSTLLYTYRNITINFISLIINHLHFYKC